MDHSELSLAERNGITHRPLAPNDEQATWTPIACGEGIVMPGSQSTDPVTCPVCLALEEDGVRPPAQEMVNLPSLIAAQMGSSRAEVRRMISQGALRLNGEKIKDEDVPELDARDAEVQVGRRSPFRLRG